MLPINECYLLVQLLKYVWTCQTPQHPPVKLGLEKPPTFVTANEGMECMTPTLQKLVMTVIQIQVTAEKMTVLLLPNMHASTPQLLQVSAIQRVEMESVIPLL